MPLRRMELPSDFVKNIIREFGRERADKIVEGYDSPAPVSVRINPLKTNNPDELEICSAGCSPVNYSAYGFFLKNRPAFTSDPAFQAGCYYVQEASSMYIESVLPHIGEKSSLKVLDLCAAPGGKSTHWLTLLRDFPGSLLVSNEISGSRAAVLCENISKWGAANVVVTNNEPSVFGAMGGYFDIAAVDAPCSGEGMFRKEPAAVREWSLENVGFCASRQRKILSGVWQSLKEGGLLIYSTCTLNRREDEENVGWISKELGADVLSCRKFFPGDEGAGEGFFLALLRKNSCCGSRCRAGVVSLKSGSKKAKATVAASLEGELAQAVREGVRLFRKGDIVKAYPADLVDEMKYVESKTKVLMSGVAVASVKEGGRSKRVYVPEHDFVQSELYVRDSLPEIDIDRETALEYMKREKIQLPCAGAPAGYAVLTYRGTPLGLIKNLGGRVNNLWPASRRILSLNH